MYVYVVLVTSGDGSLFADLVYFDAKNAERRAETLRSKGKYKRVEVKKFTEADYRKCDLCQKESGVMLRKFESKKHGLYMRVCPACL